MVINSDLEELLNRAYFDDEIGILGDALNDLGKPYGELMRVKWELRELQKRHDELCKQLWPEKSRTNAVLRLHADNGLPELVANVPGFALHGNEIIREVPLLHNVVLHIGGGSHQEYGDVLNGGALQQIRSLSIKGSNEGINFLNDWQRQKNLRQLNMWESLHGRANHENLIRFANAEHFPYVTHLNLSEEENSLLGTSWPLLHALAHTEGWRSVEHLQFKDGDFREHEIINRPEYYNANGFEIPIAAGNKAENFVRLLTNARMNGRAVLPALKTINGKTLAELGIPPVAAPSAQVEGDYVQPGAAPGLGA